MSDQWWPEDPEGTEEVIGWFGQIQWQDEEPSHGTGLFIVQQDGEEQCWIDWEIDVTKELDCSICTFAFEIVLLPTEIEVNENCGEYLPESIGEMVISIGFKEPSVFSYGDDGWTISGEGEFDMETALFEFFIVDW